MEEEIKTGSFPKGKQTKEILKKKGIISPPIYNLINIGKGIWVECPNKYDADFDCQKFIEEKRKFYNLK
jgi:hypothetical protein